MSNSFYFYDLETSGVSPRDSRIMQFGGQRTDMNLEPIGEPDSMMVRLGEDVLPSPDAILITGITPQATLADGITEAEFLDYFISKAATPNTIMVGFNNIRFDDEFMRFSLYRNFYDAYEWQWKDGRSRWDLLDLVRMVRALRPGGVEWPFGPDGAPSNRLELLASVNKLDHSSAHDAVSDVEACIALAQLIRDKQPKLFDYLLNLRDKRKVAALAGSGDPFVYTSGRYPGEFQKTTIVAAVGLDPTRQGVFVFDLRYNPEDFTSLSPSELAELWKYNPDKDAPRLPVKSLQFNRAPAIAPLGVVDTASQERLELDMGAVKDHHKSLLKAEDFGDKLIAAQQLIGKKDQASLVSDINKVDSQLYDGFVNDADKTKMSMVRAADAGQLADLEPGFTDERLNNLLLLYKARNFKSSLNEQEQEQWEKFRTVRLLGGGDNSQAARYFKRLAELAERKGLTQNEGYLLEELQLWGQSILPVEP